MRRLLALAILAAAVGGFILLKATRPAPPAVEVRERAWRVATEIAEPAAMRPTLTLYGRVEAPDRVRAAAPVPGRVLDVMVRDGDRVAAGQPLVELDPRDLLPRLELARADLERERIRVRHDREALQHERTLLELAEVRLARVEKLQSARVGAESAVDQVREEIARVRLAVSQRQQAIAEHPARLAQLQARLDEAERDAERSRIEAPFSARIGKVDVAAGDQVQAGQILLTFYADNPVYLRAKIPAMYAAELRMALDAGERPGATANFGTTLLVARLERIGGEADARGVDALLRLENGENVPVGAFVNAVLERPAAADLLSLPFSALHGGDRIYLVRDGRLRSVKVERVGEHRVDGAPRMLLRVADLDSGAEVMITHLPNAIDGLAVEVLGE